MPRTKSRKKPGPKKKEKCEHCCAHNVNGEFSLRGGLPRFWRLVHTGFQISNKEFVIMSMKDIPVQLELKYIEKQNLKI